MVKLQCIKCNHEFEVDDLLKGEPYICPTCWQSIQPGTVIMHDLKRS